MNPVHESAFEIALEAVELHTFTVRFPGEFRFDVSQRGMPIDPRFALAQQVQIRTVQQQNVHSWRSVQLG